MDIPHDEHDPISDLTPLSMLLDSGELPFRTMKPALRLLDRLHVPYLLIGGRRFYRIRVIRDTLQRNEITPTAAA
jgi:hypothetical protein